MDQTNPFQNVQKICPLLLVQAEAEINASYQGGNLQDILQVVFRGKTNKQ